MKNTVYKFIEDLKIIVFIPSHTSTCRIHALLPSLRRSAKKTLAR